VRTGLQWWLAGLERVLLHALKMRLDEAERVGYGFDVPKIPAFLLPMLPNFLAEIRRKLQGKLLKGEE
jgi:hypothetical protein